MVNLLFEPSVKISLLLVITSLPSMANSLHFSITSVPSASHYHCHNLIINIIASHKFRSSIIAVQFYFRIINKTWTQSANIGNINLFSTIISSSNVHTRISRYMHGLCSSFTYISANFVLFCHDHFQKEQYSWSISKHDMFDK